MSLFELAASERNSLCGKDLKRNIASKYNSNFKTSFSVGENMIK